MAPHPQVQGLLDALAAQGQPPFSSMTPPQAREAFALVAGLSGERVEVDEVREESVPVDGGTIPVRVYRPAGAGPLPVVLFVHGGGWVIGDLDTYDSVPRRLCRDSGAVVVSVGYRLAPEARFPTAADDCLAAARWVVEHADELGVDPERLAVCGDSAGGNLAAVLTQDVRAAGGPAVRAAALIYPATDLGAEGGSMTENATGYFLQRDDMTWFGEQYLTDPSQVSDPRASPARGDLAGLPPTFVATCEFDPLRDQGEAYADALRAAGVEVTARRYDGMIHGIINLTGVVDGGGELLADVAGFLRTTLG